MFVFNFHPNQSFTDYRIGTSFKTKHTIVLCTDDREFGGLGRVDTKVEHFGQDYGHYGRPFSVQVYLPCRCAIVLRADK